MGRETVVLVGNLKSTSCCRICHEDEFDGPRRLEAPCACSGTVKFAHRECIQRWCDEKGNATCEICLQKYEPRYTAAPKKDKVEEEVMSISLEIPRQDDEEEEEALGAFLHTQGQDCSSADRNASCCKSIAVIFTVLLLVKHMLAVISGETVYYPFTLPTVIALKSCGIIVPMYVIVQTITGIRNRIRKYHHHRRRLQLLR